MAHNVVEQWINARGKEVEYSGGVVEDAEDIVEPLRFDARGGAVDRHQALGVEGRPADKECHRNRN